MSFRSRFVQGLDRRTLMMAAGATGLSGATTAFAGNRSTSRQRQLRHFPAQTTWQAEPAQVAATHGRADVGGAQLSYWDTGGSGPAVVLLHANTGSAMTWGYQQPVLAEAGFRVIGYSRRGYQGSETGDAAQPGTAVDDLLRLLDHLKIRRCHVVGTALGGFTVSDFAIAHTERLQSMTIASSLAGITDPDFVDKTETLLPPNFSSLPPEFRELGPSYRASNPAGVARWLELQRGAVTARALVQRRVGKVSVTDLASITCPQLLITGDADLYMPPARMRELAQRLPRANTAILAEAGHAAFWEQPIAFNKALLDFIAAT